MCHVSTKESVEIIRQAKKAGIDVTCETAPHYLVFSDNELKETGRFKMNPPIRGIDDREALIKGLIDGTVDMIATDHAPHAVYEKNKGLENSAFGVVGLETAFPILNAKLVLKDIIYKIYASKNISHRPQSTQLAPPRPPQHSGSNRSDDSSLQRPSKIGRASCRERV